MKIYGLHLQANSLHVYPPFFYFFFIFLNPMHYADTCTFTGLTNIFDCLDLKIVLILS